MVSRVARQLGIGEQTLRNWVERAEIDTGRRPGTTTEDKARIAELEKEIRELAPGQCDPQVGVGFFRGGARPPQAVVRYIDAHKEEFGVEPICRVLQVRPLHLLRRKIPAPLSPRAVSDELLGEHIKRIHEDNYGVYGVRKVWHQLRREGEHGGRDQVGRVMGDLGLEGVRRGKAKRTTVPGDLSSRPADLVDRHFFAAAPNRLWLADITYVWTWSGFCYTSFITDAFARRIVGWRVVEVAAHRSRSRRARDGHLLPAPTRTSPTSFIIPTAASNIWPFATPSVWPTNRPSTSVGSKGDSFDNALAETVNGLYKTELIHRRGPWKTMEQLELATGGLGQLVERASPTRGLWLRPAGRVRGELLPSLGRGQLGCVKPNHRASTFPGRKPTYAWTGKCYG